MSIITTAIRLARRYRQRSRALERAVARGLRDALMLMENQQVENLTGPGTAPAGSYPVPVRTGNLRRSAYSRARNLSGEVGNTAAYATKIHDDRPFLDEAVASVDADSVIRRRMWAAL